MTLVLQEVRCPACRGSWDLDAKEFVAAGDTLTCKYGCGPFTATAETVTCCMEDIHGMVQLSLPGG